MLNGLSQVDALRSWCKSVNIARWATLTNSYNEGAGPVHLIITMMM